MKIFKYMMAIAALLTVTACSGKASPDPSKGRGDSEEQSVTKLPLSSEGAGGRLLVVFFSHAGDNYAVGNIKVGNTKIVADYISTFTVIDDFLYLNRCHALVECLGQQFAVGVDTLTT